MVYVCENNLWAVNTPAHYSVATPDVAARAAGYGIPGVIVDGNDVVAVYEAAQTAIDRARAGHGPSLIECKTYRHRRHTERATQPDVRPQHEIDEWMAKDPIPRLRERLAAHGFTQTDFAALDAEVLAEIDAAVAFAEASPFPSLEAVLDDVYA